KHWAHPFDKRPRSELFSFFSHHLLARARHLQPATLAYRNDDAIFDQPTLAVVGHPLHLKVNHVPAETLVACLVSGADATERKAGQFLELLLIEDVALSERLDADLAELRPGGLRGKHDDAR